MVLLRFFSVIIWGIWEVYLLNIVVPVYEAKATLFRLLESMTKNKCAHGLGLILVFDHDGENYDEEIAFARAHFVTDIIKLAKNVGPGLARQAGLNKCTKDFVMFADADDYFYPGALDSVEIGRAHV